MLNQVSYQQLQLVIDLLQNYMDAKKQNNMLHSWIKIKSYKKNQHNHSFSNISFAQHQTQGRTISSNHSTHSFAFRNNLHKQSINGDPYHRRKQFLQKIKNSIQEIKNTETDDQFQDIVLNKIKNIQQRLNKVKSTQSNSSYADSISSRVWNRTQYSKDSTGQIIKFNLNARYIPMKAKLENLQSFVHQKHNYSMPSQGDSQQFHQSIIRSIQTPRIGRRESQSNIIQRYQQPVNSHNNINKYKQPKLQSVRFNSNIRQTYNFQLTSQKSARKAKNSLPITMEDKKIFNQQPYPQDKHENNKELNKEYLKIASKVKQASPLRFKHYDSQQKINKTPYTYNRNP